MSESKRTVIRKNDKLSENGRRENITSGSQANQPSTEVINFHCGIFQPFLFPN